MYSWLSQWTTVITTITPYGEDITFSEEFDAIRLEVDKGVSIHSEGQTDWQEVLERCSTMLAENSKDLWLFCYASRAALSVHGHSGLAAALQTFSSYLSEHWPGVYPAASKMARRAAPFTWLIGQIEGALSLETLTAVNSEICGSLRISLERIQDVLSQGLGDAAPSFAPLLRGMPDPRQRQPKKEKTARPKSHSSSQQEFDVQGSSDSWQLAAQTPQQTGEKAELPHGGAEERDGSVPTETRIDHSSAVSVTPAPDLPKMSDSSLAHLIRSASESVRQLGGYYLAHNPSDWKPYALHRAVLWGSISQLPDVSGEGLTQIRPPARERVHEYTAAVKNRQHVAILPQLEKTASQGAFWLDGHFLVVQCLTAMQATQAATAISTALRCFISTFPQLVGYCFYDSAPFASEETRNWIASLEQQKADPSSLFLSATHTTGNTAEKEQISYALDMLHSRGFNEAFNSFGSLPLTRSRQGIMNALTKIKFCLMAGKPQAALTLAVAAYNQLEEWDMVEWEPELSAQLLGLIVKSKDMPAEKRSSLVQKLHWLHLETALNLGVE